MVSATLTGTVLERDGSGYRVLTDAGEVSAVLRGKAKRGATRVIVGDVVDLEVDPDGRWYAISGVKERTSLLARRVPEGRGERPVVANIDQVVVVAAASQPPPVPQLIDRMLVIAEANQLAPVLVVNKMDLDPAGDLIARYRSAGYRVFPTSAAIGEGVADLKAALHGRESVFTGPSGVGKSSLLNSVQPGLRLRVGAVSRRVRRGRHTTVSSVMLPLDGGGFIVDTPGFSEVGLWGLPLPDLGGCFPEFAGPAAACRYANCLHDREPGCAVARAVAEGAIDRRRYDSYLALLGELRDEPRAWE